MSARIGPFLTTGLLLFAACGGEGEDQQMTPAQRDSVVQAARQDTVELAIAAYDPAAFDTVQWESWQQRVERGGTVWRWSCAKCHGPEGEGDGEMAREYGFDVPSLVADDWHYAGEPDSIRRRIYVGHQTEMPSWGLYGLTYRDIDATVEYILEELRS